MTDVDPEGTVSVAKAAKLLGITVEEAYGLVFQQRLATVEAPSGRRVIPVTVIEQWQRDHPIHA
jgi:hypothetical protein